MLARYIFISSLVKYTSRNYVCLNKTIFLFVIYGPVLSIHIIIEWLLESPKVKNHGHLRTLYVEVRH